MKNKAHIKTVSAKLPELIPHLQKVLHENGLEDFLIGKLDLVHRDDARCSRPCTGNKECQQVVDPNTGEMVWKCMPKRS